MRRIATLVAVILAATGVPAIVSPQAASAARPNAAAQVADISPGGFASGPYDLTRFGDIALFEADDGSHGYELWATDGTAAGTNLVKDINPGGLGSTPHYFTVFGDIVLFVATDATGGAELWKTDGTAAGTLRVKDINPGVDPSFVGFSDDPEFTVFGNLVLFKANSPDGSELWRTDGTNAGTTLIDLAPGLNSVVPRDLTAFGGSVLFFGDASVIPGLGSTKTALLKTDGTVPGTSIVKEVDPGNNDGSQITTFGPIALFVAHDATGNELWKTDGTSLGTTQVKDIAVGGDSNPRGFTPFGSIVLFTASNSSDGDELWKTDGTETGTVMVKDIYTAPNSGSVPHGYTVFGSKVLFVAAGGDGYELWKTDGTEGGTSQVKDICSVGSSSDPQDLTVFGSVVVFSADDCVHGRELWASNGTSAGTSLVTDLNPADGVGSNPISLLPFGATMLFSADDGVDSQELFRTVVRRVPGAPTIGTATAGNTQATVTFTPPASNGGSPITSYTVTSTPGGITKTGAGSPLTVTGLINGVSYRFSVHATNAIGNGPESALSNAVTPSAAKSITVVQPNGGEHIARGASYLIKWNYTGNPGTTLKITLLKSGTVVQTIASSQAIGTGGAGQRSWTPPTSLAAVSTYKIRIVVNASSPVIADMSNTTFSLT